jgi:hypothetical protein
LAQKLKSQLEDLERLDLLVKLSEEDASKIR